MPIFNAAYTVPKPSTTEVADGTRAAFQNEEESALFSGLGLRDGGFQANADRVFVLDDTDKLVAAPPYDAQTDNGMAAAAQAGRLFVMGKDYRLRQVRLEEKEDDGFAFAVTNHLSLRQLPRLTMDYFFKRFMAICNDFARNVSQTFNETMEKMAENFNNLKNNLSQIFGGRNHENEQAGREVEIEPPVSEDVRLETQQTGTTLEEQQTQQAQTKPWKYQAKDTRNMSNEDFFNHVEAAYKRGEDLSVISVLTGKDCTPEKYYEAMTQQLEAQVARDIYLSAVGQTDAEKRNQILEANKKNYTAIVVGLGDYVVNHTNKADLSEHCKQPQDNTPEYAALKKSSDEIFLTGVNGYIKQLDLENATNEPEKRQEQPENKVTLENEASKNQQEINPFTKA